MRSVAKRNARADLYSPFVKKNFLAHVDLKSPVEKKTFGAPADRNSPVVKTKFAKAKLKRLFSRYKAKRARVSQSCVLALTIVVL